MELHEGLLAFFHKHPEYSSSPFWVSGESYAGKYVPNFAWETHLRKRVNLQGVVIGNGMYRPEIQYAAVPEFAFANGLIDEAGKAEATQRFARCVDMIKYGDKVQAFSLCEGTLRWLYQDLAGGVFQYDVGEPDPHKFDSLTTTMSDYLNKPATRAALHVGEHFWQQHDETGPVADGLAADFVKPSDIVIEKLLGVGYQVVLYNGIRDGSLCNHLGNLEVLLKLRWSGSKEWIEAPQQPWYCDGGLLCGYTRAAKNLKYVIYLRTGHLVPTTVPSAALDMWSHILPSHSAAADGAYALTRVSEAAIPRTHSIGVQDVAPAQGASSVALGAVIFFSILAAAGLGHFVGLRRGLARASCDTYTVAP